MFFVLHVVEADERKQEERKQTEDKAALDTAPHPRKRGRREISHHPQRVTVPLGIKQTTDIKKELQSSPDSQDPPPQVNSPKDSTPEIPPVSTDSPAHVSPPPEPLGQAPVESYPLSNPPQVTVHPRSGIQRQIPMDDRGKYARREVRRSREKNRG
uniref:Histone-lysine N-methyltransferase 2B-like n=1 Tax=Crassostrea virginica TaxID=6565 RepID=A0A8B8DWI4_CRAVI|nr:histone-lysine N-methyltransferase 2B-like [Crassostrea virginica]